MTSNDINFLHLDVCSRSHHKVKGHRRWGVCLCECYVYFYLIYLFFFFWGGGETCFCYGYPTFAFSHGFVSSTMSMEMISKSKVLNSASWYNCVDWLDMKSDVGSNILSILGHRWRSKIIGLKVFVFSEMNASCHISIYSDLHCVCLCRAAVQHRLTENFVQWQEDTYDGNDFTCSKP